MTIFEGQVRNYTLIINTPGPPKSRSVVALDMEAAGLAFLNFVPQGGTLGTNSKRIGTPTPDFDIWSGLTPTRTSSTCCGTRSLCSSPSSTPFHLQH